MINQKFIFFCGCELYTKLHFPCLRNILESVRVFPLSVTLILGFEMIFKCIFELVFWSPFDFTRSLTSCIRK